MEPLYSPELERKIDSVFDVFDKTIMTKSRVTLAYSGGKDSTVLATLLLKWVRERRVHGLKVRLIHNDTLSEIDPMEEWARGFMKLYKEIMEDLRNEVSITIAKPSLIDSFYWRVLIRGYPAPTRNFRWCVHLLKMKPTESLMKDMRTEDELVMTGLREDESVARNLSMKDKYGGCPLGPSKCLAYYFATTNGDARKVAPLRDWSTADVWEFLRTQREVNISDLLYLYGCEEARYGCWHCTLATVQWGLHALDKRYLYLDALRLLYRKISDLPYLRLRKNYGYSKLGALNAAGRCLMYNLIPVAEEKSELRLYGLDELNVNNISLRELLYEMDVEEAQKIIDITDPKLDPARKVELSKIRNSSLHAKILSRALKEIVKNSKNDKSIILARKRGFDPFLELLNSFAEMLQISDSKNILIGTTV